MTAEKNPVNTYKIIRTILLFVILIFSTFYSIKILNDCNFMWSKQDFRQYWSAGKILLEGQNPYDFETNTEIQSPISSFTMVTFIPPWAILWLSPLSLLQFNHAEFLWLLLNIMLLFISGYVIWGLCDKLIFSENLFVRPPFWGIIFIGTFYPALYCLRMGQASILLLFGISLFLYFRTKGKYFLAGISISILFIKPHLFSLLWIALAYEGIERRKWRTIFGMITVFLFSNLIVILMQPDIFIDYFHYVQNPIYIWPENVSIGGFLGAMGYQEKYLNAPATKVSFIPVLIASILFLMHIIKNRKDYSLDENIPIIISLSIFVTPYGWVTDQTLLLVVFIAILNFLNKKFKKLTIIWIASSFGINASFGYLHFNRIMPEYVFFPVPFFCLMVFLYLNNVHPNKAYLVA